MGSEMCIRDRAESDTILLIHFCLGNSVSGFVSSAGSIPVVMQLHVFVSWSIRVKQYGQAG